MKNTDSKAKPKRLPGVVSSRIVRRQALDEANHVSHELRISAMGRGITVGQLKDTLTKLDIPNDATIKFALRVGEGWALLESVSFCRTANEVSLW